MNDSNTALPDRPISYPWVMGISLTADSIDICLLRTDDETIFTEHFNNNMTGFQMMRSWISACGNPDFSATLSCLEYAGYNIQAIVQYLLKCQAHVWLRSHLQLKRTLKLSGEGNRADAAMLAHFAFTHQHKATPVTLQDLHVGKLKDLQANARRIVKAILILESSVSKIALRDEESAKTLEHLNSAALRGLRESLAELEEKISHYTFSLKLSIH
jgi:transposase